LFVCYFKCISKSTSAC